MSTNAPGRAGGGNCCAVGVDVVDIHDVERALSEHGDAYVQRVFTPAEAAYCRGGASPDAVAQRFAQRFGAKEALLKALGWGDRATSWHGIEVAPGTRGGWRVVLSGPVAAAAVEAGMTDFTLSMGHAGGLATAVVTATRVRASHIE
ncbi:MAG TPA: 4'-phosphopantetheinyl transferase superfamily protein [Gemmatimonadaceae bacterium]|nr:4'-phosphopantetheinyl transferase superfamily protein [Gemmatimonadaceae bacterium]